jgi:protein involved in polysaccharide export with SLBB domain
MKNRRLFYFSHIFLFIIFGRILISAQTSTPEPVSENSPELPVISEENLIHRGDLIDVDVVGSTEYDWRGTLTDEGFLRLVNYSESPIYGLCRNEETVAADVVKSLSKFLREPKVIVKILDRSNRPVAVLNGAVKIPQRFRLNRPVFLNEIIINSGGFTEKVSGDIQIFRPKSLNCLSETTTKEKSNDNETKKEKNDAAAQDNSEYINIKIIDLINGKKEANPQILSGDVINVLEAESVYVIGGVANPKQLSFRSQITVSRAVASAGGLTKDALPQKITIFRRENKSTKIIEADLDKIKANPAEDVVLQASDIIEVAQKGRSKRKYPPIIKTDEPVGKNSADLPLRIID